jgi:hypothetical protein
VSGSNDVPSRTIYITQSGSAYADILPTDIYLNSYSVTLVVGESYQLIATVLPSNATDRNVAWASTDNSVASVSAGYITALSSGTARITASTYVGGYSATCDITVLRSDPVSPVDPPVPPVDPDPIVPVDPSSIESIPSSVIKLSLTSVLLSVSSPYSERITIYSSSGVLLFHASKEQGSTGIDVSQFPRGVLLVHGSSGWSRKIIRQ